MQERAASSGAISTAPAPPARSTTATTPVTRRRPPRSTPIGFTFTATASTGMCTSTKLATALKSRAAAGRRSRRSKASTKKRRPRWRSRRRRATPICTSCTVATPAITATTRGTSPRSTSRPARRTCSTRCAAIRPFISRVCPPRRTAGRRDPRSGRGRASSTTRPSTASTWPPATAPTTAIPVATIGANRLSRSSRTLPVRAASRSMYLRRRIFRRSTTPMRISAAPRRPCCPCRRTPRSRISPCRRARTPSFACSTSTT